MAKCVDQVMEAAATTSSLLSQDVVFISSTEKEGKTPYKRFGIDMIDEEEESLRKKILWQIADLSFKQSPLNPKVHISYDYNLPVEQLNIRKQLSIIIRIDPGGFLTGKFELEDMYFIVLNNEMDVRHRARGQQTYLLKAGERLYVPKNKRFHLQVNDVDTSHILLLMQPSSSMPSFLST